MKYSKEQKDRIAELYLSLGTYKKVCEAAGCSMNTVWRVCAEYGIGVGTGGNQGSKRKVTDEEILQDIDAGLTRRQIAEKRGIHVENLARRMRKLGKYARKPDKTERKPNKGDFKPLPTTNTWHETETTKMLASRYADFEYLGYKKHRVRLRCKTCGWIIERPQSCLRRSETLRCENCESIREENKLRRNLAEVLTAIMLSKTPRTCARCGRAFCSQYASQKYCSQKCRMDEKRSVRTHRKRCAKAGATFNSKITLGKVYARDGGICQICGKPTRWDDKSWTGSFGPEYPTIDHIKAIANGGGHTWDNVQLAHALCNSYKRDLVV